MIAGALAPVGRRLRAFAAWTGVADRKLIDYVQMIVLPVVLLVGGQFVSHAVNASARAQAAEQAQESRLASYLDQVARLSLDRDLLSPELDRERAGVVREVARAQTLTALDGMDGHRKRFVMTFLYELGLINGAAPLVSLATADLSDAALHATHLFGVNLTGANLAGADLTRARLTSGILNQVDFSRASLEAALLVDARLNNTDLRLASLAGANLANASMFNADLRRADLAGADLTGANLRSTDLRGADLRDADLTNADLSHALLGHDPGNPALHTNLQGVTWANTTCPDGATSEAHGGTCPATAASPPRE